MYYMCFIVLVIFATGDSLDVKRTTCDWNKCRKDCSIDTCMCVELVRTCLSDLTCDIDLDLEIYKLELDTLFKNSNCTIVPSSTISTIPSLSPVPSCQQKLPKNFVMHDLNNATVHPSLSLINALCKQHSYHALRHCSLFTFSHLRPFEKDYIETCSLPGSWYLLHHPDVTIEITGGIKNTQSLYTNIDVINITLQSEYCTLKAVFNYIARADKDLPTTISSTDPKIIALFQPLEFHIDSSRRTVTILAPWLNLTVVIRKLDNHLSIVTRLPADLVDYSNGLCNTGCPSHTKQNIKSAINQSCFKDKLNASFSCAASLLNALPQSNLSIQMANLCQFDILHGLRYLPLSLYKGIVRDYKTLPNDGEHIIPITQPPEVFVLNVSIANRTPKSIHHTSTTTISFHQETPRPSLSTTTTLKQFETLNSSCSPQIMSLTIFIILFLLNILLNY